MDGHQWTAEDVQSTAEEFGYDPEKFAAYMNEVEKLDAERHKIERARQRVHLSLRCALAEKYGITSAAAADQEQLDKMDAWDKWRVDPKNNPFPGL